MRSKFTTFYAALFLVSQIAGLVIGILGFAAPRHYLIWGFFIGTYLLWVLMMGSSLYMPIHIWRCGSHAILYVLPAFYLTGEAAMYSWMKELTERYSRDWGLEGMTAAVAALQDADLVTIVTSHSLVGVITCLYVVTLTRRAEVQEDRQPASRGRSTAAGVQR